MPTARANSSSTIPGPDQKNQRNAILVTGLPKSGKTTLVRNSRFPRTAAAIAFSDLMDELLEGTGGRLETLWPATRAALQLKAAQRLVEYEPNRQLVIDGHLLVPTSWGFTRGVPPAVWNVLKLSAIVIVHVPQADLIERIESDGADPRTISVKLEEMRVLESLMHATVASYAMGSDHLGHSPLNGDAAETGCQVSVVVNAKGTQEEAAKSLAAIVSRLSGAGG